MILGPLHVIVKFGTEVPKEIRGPALLEFERMLRKMAPGKWIEVFGEYKPDDSKLRSMMTPEQRNAL